MSEPVEREIKLRVSSAAQARATLHTLGAVVLRERRLQSDVVLDTVDQRLGASRCALRVRVEPDRCFLTFKGPPQVSTMKLREELETAVADSRVLLSLFERLGYYVSFRYEKYREEFTLDDVVVAIDETPLGTFLEIEGGADGIARAAQRLGKGPRDYIVESYRALHFQRCMAAGIPVGDLVFDR